MLKQWALRCHRVWSLLMLRHSRVVHSCVVHPCFIVPTCPLPRCPLSRFQRPRTAAVSAVWSPLNHSIYNTPSCKPLFRPITNRFASSWRSLYYELDEWGDQSTDLPGKISPIWSGYGQTPQSLLWDAKVNVSLHWKFLFNSGTDMYRSATCDSLLTFHSNHGAISYRFRNTRRSRSKIETNFPTPCILRPRWRGSPWNWVSVLGVKKTTMMGLYIYPDGKELSRYL